MKRTLKSSDAMLLLLLLCITYISPGSAFHCPRHSDDFTDVSSLTVTSSIVAEVTPDMTPSALYDVTSGLCRVTLETRKLLKDSLGNDSIFSSTGDKKNSKRITLGFCIGESGNSEEAFPSNGNLTLNKSRGINTNLSADCAMRIFTSGINNSYIVFLVHTELIVGDSKVVELVSIHSPIVSNKKNLRDVRKYSCPTCGLAPTTSVKPGNMMMKVELKKRLQLNCRTSGSPPPTVEWLRNGEVLDLKKKRYKIKSTEKGLRLRVGKAEKRDCGEYRCKAVNVLGESISQSVYVSIGSDVVCPSSHKYPCPQQTYCMHGGSCWILSSTGSQFCECTAEFQGARCDHKRMPPPGKSTEVGTGRMVPIVSVIAIVLGTVAMLSLFVMMILYTRMHVNEAEKKRMQPRHESPIPDPGEAQALYTESSNTVHLPHTPQVQLTLEDDMISVRDQIVQTDLSLILGRPPPSPFIQVQIQSAAIQPSTSRRRRVVGRTASARTDSMTSTGRARLSAITDTPDLTVVRRRAYSDEDNDDDEMMVQRNADDDDIENLMRGVAANDSDDMEEIGITTGLLSEQQQYDVGNVMPQRTVNSDNNDNRNRQQIRHSRSNRHYNDDITQVKQMNKTAIGNMPNDYHSHTFSGNLNTQDDNNNLNNTDNTNRGNADDDRIIRKMKAAANNQNNNDYSTGNGIATPGTLSQDVGGQYKDLSSGQQKSLFSSTNQRSPLLPGAGYTQQKSQDVVHNQNRERLQDHRRTPHDRRQLEYAARSPLVGQNGNGTPTTSTPQRSGAPIIVDLQDASAIDSDDTFFRSKKLPNVTANPSTGFSKRMENPPKDFSNTTGNFVNGFSDHVENPNGGFPVKNPTPTNNRWLDSGLEQTGNNSATNSSASTVRDLKQDSLSDQSDGSIVILDDSMNRSDILEPIGRNVYRTNSQSAPKERQVNGSQGKTIRGNSNVFNSETDYTDPYDSDPKATVV